ncbi:unnamed protein product [Prorocentrum cordatum]|uniref:Uncharacterized protein n=1 Tax=Prorocentrum cordatum TaxID=2364126 RepID=A0ABN9X963_9DINO|nr:unnamed protein product [Polarella glacialis]
MGMVGFDCVCPHTLGAWIKQLRSLGYPTWDDIGLDSEGAYAFCYTRDRGPDEAHASKLLAAMLAPRGNILFMGSDCQEHARHLIALDCRKIADGFLKHRGSKRTYFSTLAKLANVIREVIKELYHNFCNLYGYMDDNRCMKKPFPSCVAGRWGSVDVVEEPSWILAQIG